MQPSQHIERLPSSYIREILQAATAPNCLSLAGGLPNEALFPYEVLTRTLTQLGDNIRSHASLFQYGLTQGYPPLVDYLKTHCQLPSNHELMITTGSQQGIDLVARGFLAKGDGVAMEAPSYLGAIQAFSLTEASLYGVLQLADGPDLEQLEALFKRGKCKLFYAVPDFHNPTGCSWSRAVREQVATLCTRYDILLLEDAPYRDIRFTGENHPLVSRFCPDHSIVLRSFSKTTMPGLRLASITGPAKLLQPLMRIKQAVDLHSNLPSQFILLQVLSDAGYGLHRQTLCESYGERYRKLCEEVDRVLWPFGIYQPVQGGMFLWFKLHKLDAMQVAARCLEHGVAVVPSPVFYHQPELVQQALRLNFSHLGLDDIGLAVERLGRVMGEM
ncbi:PLP-dependent aminotransferase family protein [Teredinibacter haidensis]|uniref:aminotransferase-like domain-containing protein n=1 Tax=Teredinibacter haidensis TaxID=2731755 RepID=UPI000948F2A1|nr:PLP-dependent aminotransferase family protein [Teredinibacter haidensis]